MGGKGQELSPTRGHERAGQRPALVVSVDAFSHGPAGLVVVAPVTTRDGSIPVHVRVAPSEGGLSQRSVVLFDHLSSVAKERLIRLGTLSAGTLAGVEDRLRGLLRLQKVSPGCLDYLRVVSLNRVGSL